MMNNKIKTSNLFFLIIIFAVLILVISHVFITHKRIAISLEIFGLSDVIEFDSVCYFQSAKSVDMVYVNISNNEWYIASQNLIKNHNKIEIIQSISLPLRSKIMNHLLKSNAGNYQVYAVTDSINGVFYCIIGQSTNDTPILFFAHQGV